MITIVTAVYNGASTIADCLRSVRSQTVPAEHLIIDGLSKDGTLDIVREVSPGARIHSGKDKGIYDAMNKGLRLASGEVIGILNADDFYAGSQVLEKVAAAFRDPDVEACYGDLVYVRPKVGGGKAFGVSRYWKAGAFVPRDFYWGWMPPHPTFFVRRRVYERCGLFDLDLGSAADYELMLRFLLRHRIRAAYIPEVLVQMREGGVSNASWANRWKANRNDCKAWARNGLSPLPWTLALKPIRKLPQLWSKGPEKSIEAWLSPVGRLAGAEGA
jgi:glycosyltransferase involved in cell wall biosynthesis